MLDHPRTLAVPLAALLACDPVRPPVSPATPAPSPSPSPPVPASRPVVRSCTVPTTIKPAEVRFDPRIELGEAGGVTWLFGYSPDPALAHLGPDGALALTPVATPPAQAGAVAGDRLWLYTSGPRGSATSWLPVDVTDPDRPVLGTPALLNVGAKWDHAEILAVGPRRALVIVGMPDDRELVLLDTATRAAVRPPHALIALKRFEPVHAFCDVDRCAVVAIAHEDGGPDRRLVVLRVLADGTREQELVAPGWIGDVQAGDHGDHVLVAWADRDGVALRRLDRRGHLVGPVTPVPSNSQPAIRSVVLATSGRHATLVVGEDRRWSAATITATTLGPLRPVPGAGGHVLVAAPLADGLVWASVGGDVSYDSAGDYSFHSWQSSVTGGFLPHDGAAPVQLPLGGGAGDGRGGFTVHILTRPGAAAALVVPRGDADGDHPTVLAPLRAACP